MLSDKIEIDLKAISRLKARKELCSGLMQLGVPSIKGFDVGVVKGSRQRGCSGVKMEHADVIAAHDVIGQKSSRDTMCRRI